MAAKVQKGDTVMVLWGKDKGKRGVVQRVIPKEHKVIVENVNIVKRHTKPRGIARQAGIIEQPAPMDLSKVAVIDPQTGEPTKVGFRVLADGTKVRYAKRSGEQIGLPIGQRPAR